MTECTTLLLWLNSLLSKHITYSTMSTRLLAKYAARWSFGKLAIIWYNNGGRGKPQETQQGPRHRRHTEGIHLRV